MAEAAWSTWKRVQSPAAMQAFTVLSPDFRRKAPWIFGSPSKPRGGGGTAAGIVKDREIAEGCATPTETSTHSFGMNTPIGREVMSKERRIRVHPKVHTWWGR